MANGKATDLTWKELLKTQNDDLKRLEALDAELNEDASNLDADIRSTLKKTSISSSFGGGKRRSELGSERTSIPRSPPRKDPVIRYNEFDADVDEAVGFTGVDPPDYIPTIEMPKTSRSFDDGAESTSSGGLRGATPKAPDANAR
jgi:hypothetical protein